MRESLKKAIIATLSYSNHFNFPLTQGELYPRLIQTKTTKQELSEGLAKLVVEGQISSQSGYYFLPGQKNLVAKRGYCAKVTASKYQLAVYYSQKISQVPGVVAILLTGSLAVDNAKQKDDIDFLIITKPQRLWFTRLILTLYLDLLTLRRRPKETMAQNKLCLNLYLTTTSLSIPNSIRSLYTAYELIQAKSVYDPTKIAPQLLFQNSWLKTYLPNYPLPKIKSNIQKPKNSWGDWLESLAYQLQLLYMKGKITREFISKDQAFFHPHDPSRNLLGKIRKILNL